MKVMIAQYWKEIVVRIDKGFVATSNSIQDRKDDLVKLENLVFEEVLDTWVLFLAVLDHLNQSLGSKVTTIFLKHYRATEELSIVPFDNP